MFFFNVLVDLGIATDILQNTETMYIIHRFKSYNPLPPPVQYHTLQHHNEITVLTWMIMQCGRFGVKFFRAILVWKRTELIQGVLVVPPFCSGGDSL